MCLFVCPFITMSLSLLRVRSAPHRCARPAPQGAALPEKPLVKDKKRKGKSAKEQCAVQ